MLDALGEHFGMDYVLPKMDAASLPDFGGAMENFGLITYRHCSLNFGEIRFKVWSLQFFSDYFMIFDESVDNFEKQHVQTEIIAHEQAHQWFGNLVTPT